jgi:hypothetical protein
LAPAFLEHGRRAGGTDHGQQSALCQRREPAGTDLFELGFGYQFDSARRAFFASRRYGQLIPVARLRGDPAFGWIDLARGAKIYLLKESGRVTAILTATDYPRGGMRWIEMDDNFSLQNLLVALFGELRTRPDG